MKIAYVDMFSGVSGDMLLGACLDAGVAIADLEGAIATLGLDDVRVSAEKVERHGIGATRCIVEAPDQRDHRRLSDIERLIDHAQLPEGVVERAKRVFGRLADAEARVHDTTPEDVHFHEVGALDAIVDIVGTVWCLNRLGVDGLYGSAFTLGHGWIDAAHGRLPVPAPAVLELVRGWPVAAGAVETELTTPTGAALVTALAEGRGLPADFVPDTIGYGAGSKVFDEQPNLVRLVVGEIERGDADLIQIECEIDDLSPQLFEPLADALERAGARDVHWSAVQMKKRRPGVHVRVLATRWDAVAVGEALFRESTTLGYRYWPVARATLAREETTVETSLGLLDVKRVRGPDGAWELRPEYEACRAIAEARGLSVRSVMNTLQRELNESRIR